MQDNKEIHLSVIMRIQGLLLLFEGFFMLTAIPITIRYHCLNPFCMPFSALITLLTGFVFYFSSHNLRDKHISSHDGVISVCLSWVMLSLFGALPYMLDKVVPSFTDAFFESMSGFTTTGATIINNVEALPKDILYWRSLTQWLGGFGVIVFSVSILPYLSISGMQLFVYEMNGITYDKLHPRAKHTTQRLLLLYCFFTLLEFILLHARDMGAFDALCHSLSTLSSGGFSTHNDSIAGFSNYSQIVIAIFMIVAGCNFSLMLLSISRKPFALFKDQEFKTYIIYIIVVGIGICAALVFLTGRSFSASVQESFFAVVSSVSTTGFYISNYNAWPPVLYTILFILMIIGGCSGSTSGGIKIIRNLMFVKNSFLELSRIAHPNAIIPVKINRKSLSNSIILKNMTLIFVYFLTLIIGFIALRSMGFDFNTSIGASIGALSNVGTCIGQVGPYGSYAFMPQIAKWMLALFMLMGRLELFIILIQFRRSFWKQ